MSQLRYSVNCKSYVATSIWCHDLIVYCTAFNSVATSKSCRDIISSLIHGCLTWSFYRDQLVLPSIALLLQLEFCGCDLDMNLHCCQGVTTSGPSVLVHLSCCNLLWPVVSVLLIHFLLLLLQKFLFLLNFRLHSSLMSYFTFLLINQSFLNKNQSEKRTKNG